MSRFGQITTLLGLETLPFVLYLNNETKLKFKVSRDNPMPPCYVERTKLPEWVINLGEE
jgi:hypothetical protein